MSIEQVLSTDETFIEYLRNDIQKILGNIEQDKKILELDKKRLTRAKSELKKWEAKRK